MNRKSILLPLDGSIYSRHAASVCWRVTGNTGAELTVQHVINTKGAREFIGLDAPGFVPAQPYESAYDAIVGQLRSLSKKLNEAYSTEAVRHGIKSRFEVSEGDPIKVISQKAQAHDLVVIGHRREPLDGDNHHRSEYARLSVAESLAHDCPCPLLIVQAETKDLTAMSIIVSVEHINELYINACLELAELLELTPEVLCVTAGENQETAEQLIDDLRNANPRIKQILIEITQLDGISIKHKDSVSNHVSLNLDSERAAMTLPVIPTRQIGGSRVTILGGLPALFVRSLNLPTLLLFPEEYLTSSSTKPANCKSVLIS